MRQVGSSNVSREQNSKKEITKILIKNMTNSIGRDDAQANREYFEDWNRGNYKIGSVVESLDVRIGEIIHNTSTAFIFLDEDGNVEWLWRGDRPHLTWASARIVELEAKCAFFRADRTQQLFASRLHGTDHRLPKPDAPADCPTESASRPRMSHGLWCWINRTAEKANLDERAEQQEEELKTKRPDSFRHELSARRFIAQGLVILCSHNSEEDDAARCEAEAVFSAADKFIVNRGREVSLIWLYEMLGKLALLSGMLTLLALLCGRIMPDLPKEVWQSVSCIGVGGLGAYVSRALAGRHDLPCDANAGRRLHREEALLRWTVGSAAGGLVFLLVEGKLLMGTLPTENSAFAVPLAFAFLSGLSERFLPSMVNRFNDQLSANRKQSTP